MFSVASTFLTWNPSREKEHVWFQRRRRLGSGGGGKSSFMWQFLNSGNTARKDGFAEASVSQTVSAWEAKCTIADKQSPAKECQPLTKETPGSSVLPPRLSIPVCHPPARRHSSDKSPGSGAPQPMAGDQLRSFESFTENPPARPAAPWGGHAGNASFPRGAPTALRRPPPGRHAPPLGSWLNRGAGAAPPPAGASEARASRPMRPRGSRAAPLTGCAAPRGPRPPRPLRCRRPCLPPPASVGGSPGEQVPSPLEGISLGLSVSLSSRYFSRGPTPDPAPQPARISVGDSSAAAAERLGPLSWVPAPRAGRRPSPFSPSSQSPGAFASRGGTGCCLPWGGLLSGLSHFGESPQVLPGKRFSLFLHLWVLSQGS